MGKILVTLVGFVFITLTYINANEYSPIPDFAYTCSKKFNITADELEEYYSTDTGGLEEYESDSDMKCFISCILEALKMMKDGKFLYEETKGRYQDPLMAQVFERYYGSCLNLTKDVQDTCEMAFQTELCAENARLQFHNEFNGVLFQN